MTNRIVHKLRFRLSAAASLLLLCPILAAQPPAAAAPAQPAPAWKTYTNSADGFRVSFPGDPDISNQRLPSQSGTLELRAYLVTPGTAALYVGVCDYGAAVQGRDPQAVLAGAEKGAIDNVKAHLVTDRKIVPGPFPGVEFDAENDSLHFTVRLYLVGSTLYQAMSTAPLNDRYPDTRRFLDSFQLIPRMAK